MSLGQASRRSCCLLPSTQQFVIPNVYVMQAYQCSAAAPVQIIPTASFPSSSVNVRCMNFSFTPPGEQVGKLRLASMGICFGPRHLFEIFSIHKQRFGAVPLHHLATFDIISYIQDETSEATFISAPPTPHRSIRYRKSTVPHFSSPPHIDRAPILILPPPLFSDYMQEKMVIS